MGIFFIGNHLSDLAVLFRELLLLAPNSFEGGAEAKLGVIRRKSLTRTHVIYDRDPNAEWLTKSILLTAKQQ
jgi:hypothetical protein